MLGCNDRLGKQVRVLDNQQKYIGVSKKECDTTSRDRIDARTSGPRSAGGIECRAEVSSCSLQVSAIRVGERDGQHINSPPSTGTVHFPRSIWYITTFFATVHLLPTAIATC